MQPCPTTKHTHRHSHRPVAAPTKGQPSGAIFAAPASWAVAVGVAPSCSSCVSLVFVPCGLLDRATAHEFVSSQPPTPGKGCARFDWNGGWLMLIHGRWDVSTFPLTVTSSAPSLNGWFSAGTPVHHTVHTPHTTSPHHDQ